MKRKMMDVLLRWRNNPEKKGLTIYGSRQIGKTYIIDEFCKNNYDNYLRLDFSTDSVAREIFRNHTGADNIFEQLSFNYRDFRPVKGSSILFLDEIQNCPDARSAIKPLVDDHRVDVITSGSLLTVRGLRLEGDPHQNGSRPRENVVERTDAGRDRVSSMGYESMVHMYAMDFEEYLWALGIDPKRTAMIRHTIREGKPFQETTLRTLNELYRRHLVIGGMPEVVRMSLSKDMDWEDISSKQSDLRDRYTADIVNYCPSDIRDRTLGSIRAMPDLLGKTNKKFVFSKAESARYVGWREYERPVDWVDAAGMASVCWNVSEPVIPLKSRRNSELKMYHFDTGLLVNAFGESVGTHILRGDVGVNQGAIVENSIANMIEKCGYDLHYYERDVRIDNGDGTEARERIEIDFILDFHKGLVAIEVKSGKNRRSGSLKKLMTSPRYENYGFKRFIKFEGSNVYIDETGVEHYPLFAAAFMDELDQRPELPEMDRIGPLEF